MQCRVRRAMVAMALPMCLAAAASADSIFVGTLERKDVKVQSYRNGVVEFLIAGRAVDPVPAEKITRLALDDEAAFTKADQAFSGGEWAAAVDGYQVTLKSTSKPWLKDWILPRLLQAADRAGRIDAAASAYVLLLPRDVSTATRMRPGVTGSMSPAALSAAAGELSKAAASPTLTPSAQQAILALLMDANRAQGDMAAAGKVADQLLKVLPAQSNDPAANRVQADVRLGVAKLAIAQKDYAKAIDQIQAHRSLYAEPNQQADALYCLATAKDGQAGAKAEKDALKDIAIDYMRAVAAARQSSDKRNLPESLVRVAEIHEQLGDTKSAAALYAEVASEYKDSPVAAKAAAAQQRLKEKNGM